MPTLLFIVSRRQPDLYEYLRRQFANEPDMKVVLDRRIAERRARDQHGPRADERRRADRRRNNEVTYDLLTMGYAFARPMAEVP
jgi:hypothetical protein